MYLGLSAIARARQKTGCAVYIFDLARLRNARSWPDALSMSVVPDVFRVDAIASERAAFTVQELTDHLEQAGLTGLEHATARPLGENQVHWAHHTSGPTPPVRFHDVPYPAGMQLLTRIVAASFPRRLT